MPHLIDLPDVAGGRIEDVEFFDGIDGCLSLLRSHRGVINAGDKGAIHVYRNDEGKFRAALCRYLTIESEICVSTEQELREWLEEQHPTIF